MSCGVILLVGAILSFDISRLNPSGSHSYTSLLLHYALLRTTLLFGQRFYRQFMMRCPDIAEQQELQCMDIIESNARTVYGLRHEFNKIKDEDDFRTQHPLTTYEHYRELIDTKITKKGSKNILTRLDPLYLALTTGITGAPKVIPLNGDFMNSRLKMHAAYASVNAQQKGLQTSLCKSLLMLLEPRVDDTEGGLRMSSVGYFLSAGAEKLPYLICHPVAFEITCEEKAFYVQAVFALRDKDLGSMAFGFASQLLSFWNYVVDNAEDICKDIETGKLKEDLDLPLKVLFFRCSPVRRFSTSIQYCQFQYLHVHHTSYV